VSDWPTWEDQVQPCRCGCGRDAMKYATGRIAGYFDETCLDEDYQKSLKQYANDEGLPTYRDVVQGKNRNSISQDEYQKRVLRQKAAKLEMLGFNGEAQTLREKNNL